MAKAVITEKSPGRARSLKSIDYGIIRLRKKGYPETIRINEVLPFRISFTNIMIPSYSSTDIPPIGIAIVGVNNYIL